MAFNTPGTPPVTPEGFPPPVQAIVEGNTNDVRTASSAVQDMAVNWLKVTTLLGGTKAMREAASVFLPKWTREEPNDYAYRLKTSVCFDAFAHTVDGLSAKPFARPLGWSTDMTPEVAAWFPNIDLTGRDFHTFAREVFGSALAYGMTHILVDYPVAKDVKTRAQEKAAKIRPYLVHIKANQILGWRSTVQNGGETLTQLRILEFVDVPDGPFAVKVTEQVRVLTPGKWEIYRQRETTETNAFGQNESKIQWYLHDQGTTSLDFIPLVTFYARRKSFMVADSPLMGIAELNIKHWQILSDMHSVLHTASIPILALIGVERNDEGSAPVEIGAKSALMLPEGATAHYVEHSGKAVAAAQQELSNIEERMRLLGAELLVKKPGQATATQATLDTSQQRSELQAITSVFEDALDQVIGIMAQYAKIDLKGCMQVYDDFLLSSDDAVQQALLFSIAGMGMLSHQSFYEAMQRRNVYDTDRPWAEEQERIASQPPPMPVGVPGAPGAPGAQAPKPVQLPKVPSSTVLAQLND